jgi:glutamate synthase (NADPH/NADH) small chain
MMGKHTGFMDYKREAIPKRKIAERIKDYREIEELLSHTKIEFQGKRCMDCGVPSCHSFGCPLSNRIPDWNYLISRNQWQKALDVLHSTDNFPEITGRICPAPCEDACTLSINEEPVMIRHIELQIIERGWNMGWIQPEPAPYKTGKRVCIIGSGPAGLAAAQQLSRAGHEVVVYERSDRIGGLLRYGIPDFKLEKQFLDRRLNQLIKEGVKFEPNVDAGIDLSIDYIGRSFDSILISAGATVPRDLTIPGRDLKGIHFAMDFLIQQNKRNAGDKIPAEQEISAKNKHVLVIGGGDTGSDCVGTAKRQGAKSITQIEIMPKPPENRSWNNPWPTWAQILRSSTSHEEGCERHWNIMTKEFIGESEKVKKVKYVKIDWSRDMTKFKEIPGSNGEFEADLVLLAMGFMHLRHDPLITNTDIKLDTLSNIIIDHNHMTSKKGIFAAGDSVVGASLVVTAINQGRKAAEGINFYLNNI